MKILYCMNSLGGKGGIERVTIVKANALADLYGYEVGICFTDKGDFPKTIHPLSSKVKVYFLNTPYWDLGILGFRKLMFHFPKHVWRTKKALEKVIDDFCPDVLINTGSYEKFACALVHPLIKGKRIKKFREFHFASNYRIINASDTLNRFLAQATFLFEKYILSHFFDKSFLLTKADFYDNYHSFRWLTGCVTYQHNPCSFANGDFANGEFAIERKKILLAVGRICPQKNFESLIEIWSMICHKLPEYKLRIIGGGE